MVRHLALVAAFLASPLAHAADAVDSLPPQLVEFVQSKEHHDAVLALMGLQWAAAVGNAACASPQAGRYQLIPMAPVEIGADGKLAKGAWREAMVLGCGSLQRQLNVHVMIMPDRTVRRIGALPGTARGDVVLQRDTLMYVAMASSDIIARDCKDTRISNTEFLGFDGAPSPNVRPGMEARPWSEDWTVLGCGAGAVVKVHYIPGAAGTTITTSGGETRRIGG